MSRRARNKAEKRARIEDAAKRLFAQRGFHGTTIRAIAAEAGVASGTVLTYFDSKVELLYELFHRELQGNIDHGFDHLPDGDLIDQLDFLFQGFIQSYAAQPELARVYVKESITLPQAQREHYDALNQAFLVRLTTLVAHHQPAFRACVDPGIVALQVFALYLTSVAQMLSMDSPSAEQTASALRAILVAALRPLWRDSDCDT